MGVGVGGREQCSTVIMLLKNRKAPQEKNTSLSSYSSQPETEIFIFWGWLHVLSPREARGRAVVWQQIRGLWRCTLLWLSGSFGLEPGSTLNSSPLVGPEWKSDTEKLRNPVQTPILALSWILLPRSFWNSMPHCSHSPSSPLYNRSRKICFWLYWKMLGAPMVKAAVEWLVHSWLRWQGTRVTERLLVSVPGNGCLFD